MDSTYQSFEEAWKKSIVPKILAIFSFSLSVFAVTYNLGFDLRSTFMRTQEK